MSTLPIEHLWHELVSSTKDNWVQIALFFVSVAIVVLCFRLFY